MEPEDIKKLRKELNLNQADFSDLFGLKKSAISKWESGDNKPSGTALKKLHHLRDGDIVVSNISDLEVKLLDHNVLAGGYKDRTDYLNASLLHLLEHGRFMSLSDSTGTRTPSEEPISLLNEDSAPYNPARKALEQTGGDDSTAHTAS